MYLVIWGRLYVFSYMGKAPEMHRFDALNRKWILNQKTICQNKQNSDLGEHLSLKWTLMFTLCCML